MMYFEPTLGFRILHENRLKHTRLIHWRSTPALVTFNVIFAIKFNIWPVIKNWEFHWLKEVWFGTWIKTPFVLRLNMTPETASVKLFDILSSQLHRKQNINVLCVCTTYWCITIFYVQCNNVLCTAFCRDDSPNHYFSALLVCRFALLNYAEPGKCRSVSEYRFFVNLGLQCQY